MYLPLPREIILKIIMYSHPILNKRIQSQIKNRYLKNSKLKFKKRYCDFCSRYHTFPIHFCCY